MRKITEATTHFCAKQQRTLHILSNALILSDITLERTNKWATPKSKFD